MKILSCFLCCLLVNWAIAQQTAIDSLQNLLSKTNSSSQKASLYQALAAASVEINPPQAMAYSQQAMALVEEDDLALKGEIYQAKGKATLYLGQLEEAAVQLDSAAQFLTAANSSLASIHMDRYQVYYLLANKYLYHQPQQALYYCDLAMKMAAVDNHTLIAMAYNTKASVYGVLADYDNTLKYLDSALMSINQTEEMTDKLFAQTGAIYSNKANVLTSQQQYQEATILYHKALEIYDSLDFHIGQASTHTNLTSVSEYLGDYEQAIIHAQKAVEIYYKTEDSSGLYTSYYNLANMLSQNQQWKEALDAIEPAIGFFEENDYKEQLGLAYLQKGIALNKLGSAQQAIFYNQKALKLAPYFNSKESLLQLYTSQADLYMDEKNFQQSKTLYQNLLDSAILYQDLDVQLHALGGLTYSNEQLGNYKAAYQYTQQRTLLQDSVQKLNSIEVIRELETKYKTKEITQQNEALQKEKEHQAKVASQNRRLFYLSIGIGLLLVVLLLIVLQYNRAKSNYKTRELKYQLLRNQMNPHFLFNVLGAIQSFIYTNNPIKAGDFLSSFANLVRAILEHSNQEYIPINKEIEWLENYVALQALRFEGELEYSLDIDPELKTQDVLLPPMLIQPIVENALEHGFKDLDYKGLLSIKMQLVENTVHIQIQDNGVGFDPAAPSAKEGHTSHATRITKERIALLNKKNTEKISFNLQSAPQQGTTASFIIPFAS